MERKIHGRYFYGNEISEYGQKNGRVDYRTLAKAFDAVLNNTVISADIGSWDLENGTDHNDETGEYYDFFQYYIISDAGAQILEEWTDEIVYYNSELDMYLWAVDHYGTSWDYVLTNIEIAEED